MRVNLRRGFLRLWIAVAVLWVAVTVFLDWDRLTSDVDKFEVTLPTGEVYVVEGPDPRTAAEIVEGLMAKNVPPPPEGFVVENNDYRAKLAARRVEVLFAVFLPPLVLLVLGVGIAWIARGFAVKRD